VSLEARTPRTETKRRGRIGEQRKAEQYLGHRDGIPIIGWRHGTEQLDRDAVMAFYCAHYAPNNAILVVSGDVEPEAVRALAQTYYGVIPANPDLKPRARVKEPPQIAERRIKFKDPRVAQEYVYRSYMAPERDPGAQRKAAALELLSELLGGGTTSFLAEQLQFDTSVAVFSRAYYSGVSLDDTTFDLVVVPSQDVSLDAAEAALDQALVDFIETGVDPDHLDRIKMQLRASQIYARDNVDGIANRYGRALAAGLTVDDVQAWPDILQDITGDEIIEAARAIFKPETSLPAPPIRDADVTPCPLGS